MMTDAPTPNTSTEANPSYLGYHLAGIVIGAVGLTLLALVLYKWTAVERHEAREAPLPALVAPVPDPTLSHLPALAEHSRLLTGGLIRLSDNLERNEAGMAPLPAAVAPASDPTLSQLTTLAEQSRILTVSLTRLTDKLQRLQAGDGCGRFAHDGENK